MYVVAWRPEKDIWFLVCYSQLPSSKAGLSMNMELSCLLPRPSDGPISVPDCWGYRCIAIPGNSHGCCRFKPKFSCLCSMYSYPRSHLSNPMSSPECTIFLTAIWTILLCFRRLLLHIPLLHSYMKAIILSIQYFLCLFLGKHHLILRVYSISNRLHRKAFPCRLNL